MRRSLINALACAAAACALVAAARDVPAAALDKLIADDGPDRTVVVHDMSSTPQGNISGVLVNNSHKELRDVRLLIHHTWLWRNEMKPGDDSPGRVDYYTVRSQLPPNGEIDFKYRPEPPLPDRDDGRFETSVEVVGWTEIGR
ncbi:MAG TPA: hypothetical protein VGK30_15580 [Candidatus Binatia bacterium]